MATMLDRESRREKILSAIQKEARLKVIPSTLHWKYSSSSQESNYSRKTISITEHDQHLLLLHFIRRKWTSLGWTLLKFIFSGYSQMDFTF